MVNKLDSAILTVDDSPFMRGLRKSVLDAGYSVVTARTGAKALEIIRAMPVRLVVVHDSLSDMTGESVCRAIHQIKPSIPLLLFSERSQSASYYSVLPRTISPDDLIERIDQLLSHVAI